MAEGDAIRDLRVSDLIDVFRPGDRLILNNTKVIPARLTGVRRRDSGQGPVEAKVEVTLLEPAAEGWRALAKPLRKLAAGEVIRFSDALSATVAEKGETDLRLTFNLAGDDFDAALAEAGAMPLPPYIAAKRAPDAADREDYQTVFARHAGAVAAPTASLHFDEALLRALVDKGVLLTEVTLHVGAGTFLPVKVDDVTTHRMHAEWGEVTAGGGRRDQRDAGSGRAGHPGRHHGAAADRKCGSRGRHRPTLARADRHLHLSRLSLPGDGCADDQLSPAEIDADDAGLGPDGRRPDAARFTTMPSRRGIASSPMATRRS